MYPFVIIGCVPPVQSWSWALFFIHAMFLRRRSRSGGPILVRQKLQRRSVSNICLFLTPHNRIFAIFVPELYLKQATKRIHLACRFRTAVLVKLKSATHSLCRSNSNRSNSNRSNSNRTNSNRSNSNYPAALFFAQQGGSRVSASHLQDQLGGCIRVLRLILG